MGRRTPLLVPTPYRCVTTRVAETIDAHKLKELQPSGGHAPVLKMSRG